MEYRSYKVRWLLIILVASAAFFRSFISRGFAVINDVVAAYYGVDPYMIDILALADTAAVAPVCLGVILFGVLIELRFLILLNNTFIFLGTGFIVTGCSSRSLYPFAAFGTVFTGISAALIYVIPPVLAANWFSKDVTAIALSFSPSFSSLGSCLAAILFPFLLPHGKDEYLLSNITNIQYNITDGGNYERFILLSTFGSCCVLAFIAMILAFIFAKNEPPTPPSAAQENIMRIESLEQKVSLREHVIKQLKRVKELFTNKQFLLNITMITLSSAFNFKFILLPSMILEALPGISNKIVGEIFFVTMLVSAIGVMIAGRVIDKFKRFKLIVAVGYIAIALSLVVTYFGFKYKNLPTIISGFILFGFWEGFLLPAQIELLIEITYPANKLVLSCLLFGIYFLFDFIFTSFERFLMEKFDETYVILFAMVMTCIDLVLLAFIEPKYKRMEMDIQAEEDERQHLLRYT